MKKIISLLMIIFMVLFSACQTGDIFSQVEDPYQLIWEELGSNSLDSMPIGNGDIGLNLWSEQDGSICFYLSKTDAWSENGRLLKLGKIRIELLGLSSDSIKGFKQQLHLKKGEISLSFYNDRKCENFIAKIVIKVDANNPVVDIVSSTNFDTKMLVSFEPWRVERRALEPKEYHSTMGLSEDHPVKLFVEPDTIYDYSKKSIMWFHQNQYTDVYNNMKLQGLESYYSAELDPIINRTFGALIEGDSMIRQSLTQIISDELDTSFHVRIIANTSQVEDVQEWIREVEKKRVVIKQINLNQRFEEHAKWWDDFWNRSYIHISSSTIKDKRTTRMITRQYIFQRWVNACGGRGNNAIKFNGSIFNTDSYNLPIENERFDADYRRWGGGYWWQNTRLLYWSFLASGDYDFMMPLFNQMFAMLDLRKKATEHYYDHSGAFFPETFTLWGTYQSRDYGYMQPDPDSGYTKNNYIRYYWQNGLELSLMLLDYYDYTRDKEFAINKTIPFIDEILKFYDQHWNRNGNGEIVFDPAMSLETYHQAINPLPIIAGIMKVGQELLELPDSLYSNKQKGFVKKLLNDLPPLPKGIKNGEQVLLPADEISESLNVENPELYAIFPYRLFGVNKENLKLARNSYFLREKPQIFGWQQDGIQAAQLGLKEEASEIVADTFSARCDSYRFPAMWGPNYDWLPDQDHGSVATIALQQMLLYCDNENYQLLPAWPKNWDVEFKIQLRNNKFVEGKYYMGELIFEENNR